MTSYKLETMYILSEYYVGLIAGIILSIAGNCTTYAISGYTLNFNGHTVFEFKADEDTEKEVEKAVDAWFDAPYYIHRE